MSGKKLTPMFHINSFPIQAIMTRDLTLESLLEMSEEEVSKFLKRFNSPSSDSTKLNAALKNLKVWTGKYMAPVHDLFKNIGLIDC